MSPSTKERTAPARRRAISRPDRSRIESRSWRRCEDCGGLLGVRAYRCHRRTCPSYAETWARDQRRRLLDNLTAYAGRAVMLTLTPPGADVLPWDEDACAHLAPHRHAGELGCRVEKCDADEWNESAPERARQLNRVAKLRADRELRRQGINERRGKLVHAWEHQKRGVLHQHFLVGMGSKAQDQWGTNVDALWSRLYADGLRELAPRYGFGFVDTRPLYSAPKPAREAAAYLRATSSAGAERRRRSPRPCDRVLFLGSWSTFRRSSLARRSARCGTCDGPAGCSCTAPVSRSVRPGRSASCSRSVSCSTVCRRLSLLVHLERKVWSLRSVGSVGTRSPPRALPGTAPSAPPRKRGALARPARRTESNGAGGAPAASPSHCLLKAQRRGLGECSGMSPGAAGHVGTQESSASHARAAPLEQMCL